MILGKKYLPTEQNSFFQKNTASSCQRMGNRYFSAEVHIKSFLYLYISTFQTLSTPATQHRHPVFFGQKGGHSHYFGIFLRSFI